MKYKIELNSQEIIKLVGVNDCNLKQLSKLYNTSISYRDDILFFDNEDETLFKNFIKQIDYLIDNIDNIDENFIEQSFKDEDCRYLKEILAYSYNGKPYRCKTYNQYLFKKKIEANNLVFGVGPAGTGKTFIAVLLAVNALKKGEINKIIITRPAVEAGESLGFLPGDLKEKIDPYLMPIYDALDAILGKEKKDSYIEKGVIEVMPLAYMRGRTLDEAFIILDEAQNTTDRQMLMFLTRLGYNSKMIVNGDTTQVDLNIAKTNSGLISAIKKLNGVKDISFVEFGKDDVVRNPLVKTIIEKFTL